MKVLNKDYNSVSGSNQVQNLNPHPPPIGMDTLDENEVDIGEVQVGLCDNMIGTNSAIWESYESYHSIDDTFTRESVEMYNELFDIPEQRDAPTKDCKGKGKVDYSSSSRKLKTKGSAWSEESSTSEELDHGVPEKMHMNECEGLLKSHNLLRRYGEALKFTNPGFLNCIRPVIVMDGTFLKNKYRGQLIVAVCLDGNNQTYPLAFGVVDRETDDSIQWFLEKLKGAIGEVPNLGFVTDRKTCFAKGISSVFPSAFHGLCVQHLSQNLHDKYKNDTVATLFYNASRTYRESTFVEAWRHLLAFPNGSGKYLNDVGIARWSRVHCPGRRYNMMTINIAESMNSILKEPRDLPIASFLENVRALLQHLDKEEVVNLQTKECTCKEFQAEQLPCSHAIAAARDRNINVYSLCANYYTNECLLAAYAEAVYPVGNQSDWKTSEDYVHMTVLPPKVVKRVGRPKKKRIPNVGEAPKLHKMAVPSDKYFPATVSCQVHKIGSLIKDKLTKDQLQMFEKTIFGPLLNVNMVFNGQLIHHFLLRQIPEDGNADGICFSVLGKNVRFTQKEFNIITGLWPTNNPLEKDCDSKRLQSLLFGSENKKLITCLEIEEIFKNFEFTNDDDAVKVALAVFIETVMVEKDKKTQFDMDILGRVDDEEAFKSFDWSTFFYTRLLNSLKTSLQGKKEAYELKKTRSSKAVSYYNIKGYVLAFQVWAYEVLSTANEHLATRNSKGLIPRILRWNCTQAPSYKMLQNNIFDNKNTVVQPKLKMSTQEKAFMESRIRGDDNMQMEEDESIGAMNNKSLEQSDSSPQREQLSPQREQSQTVAEESEMHPITKKKHFRSKKSNDKEERSHSKSYKKLKKEIKEVRKDLSTLTSIVCRMDDTITKQSLELYEMKQMLERLVQNQTENQGNDHTDQNDNEYVVQEQHTQQQPTEEQHTEHQEETQREHQEERGSDISIDGRDADLLMTIRDISDSLSHQIQKESDLPQMITTLPYVSQPLALCELAPMDQTVQIVNEESQLETTKKQVEMKKNDEAVTLVEKEPVTVPDKDVEEKPIKRRKLCKIANKEVQHEDEQGNPPTTSAQIISVSTTPVPDVEIREVDPYNPMWKVDPKLWKEYLQWKRSRKTTHEERKVVSTTRKKDFFRQLEENTWVHGDTLDLLFAHLQNKMLHLKHHCKRSFRILHSSFLTGINKPDCIVWNHIFDTHLVTPDNKKAEWTDPTAHLTIWTEKDVEYYFNTAVGDYNDIPGWGDVNYVITCINIKEHWLAIAADMRKCRIYVFDSMPNYVEQKLVDEALQMPARCIASLAIAIGVNLHSDRFTYGPWPIRRSKATLQKGRSLDCGIFCTKFVECLVTASDLGCLTVPNMKLFRQQYVLELWANKYFC
ncbi:MuDRA-like transposase [Cucumis melo var. makuwa]|uniref:MuDRA-like transposase n=1 Tax=Cucumis melo var. makuwa TaxID=1194695 RepID=A0A5A7V5S4_CUCMM|nr:MuDRA-like transposase [Cucumis melo var. makuwa]